jgi:N-methylhydantoinase A/oxoprolinase/acetone carboxylase beta subunit
VGGFPIRLPSIDVHTIGAGGGSIARIDPGGALVVGPESAGADPGPACYGLGGTAPTVTDADLVLGRIAAGAVLPGLGQLDVAAAEAALESAGVTAAGVVAVVEAAMEEALRAVSTAVGVDPRGLALVAFGGAGPLHACGLADALGMPRVIVPARAGVLSAVGILGAPQQRTLVRSWPTPASLDGLDDALRALGEEAAALVGGGAQVTRGVDVRYAGQSHEITVGRVGDFEEEHERRNGYSRPEASLEVVALRATASLPTSGLSPLDLPAVEREGADGPAVISEPDCTIWVPEGWTARPGAAGALLLERRGRQRRQRRAL